ncbi:MAG: hypothetical protein RR806_06700 [Oscillospiraceae bacterium]
MKNQVILLPPEYIRSAEKSDKLNIVKLALLAVLVGVLAILITTTFIYYNNKGKDEDVKTEIQATKEEITYYSKYRDMQKNVEDYQQCLANIIETDKRYLNSVSEISNQLPSGIWIETISTDVEKDLIMVGCGGNSPTDVGRTITALLELPNVTKAYCESSGDNNGAVRFTIAIQISQNKQ